MSFSLDLGGLLLLLLLPFPSCVQLSSPVTGLLTCFPDRLQSLWSPLQGPATFGHLWLRNCVIVANVRYSVQDGNVPTCQIDVKAMGP